MKMGDPSSIPNTHMETAEQGLKSQRSQKQVDPCSLPTRQSRLLSELRDRDPGSKQDGTSKTTLEADLWPTSAHPHVCVPISSTAPTGVPSPNVKYWCLLNVVSKMPPVRFFLGVPGTLEKLVPQYGAILSSHSVPC